MFGSSLKQQVEFYRSECENLKNQLASVEGTNKEKDVVIQHLKERLDLVENKFFALMDPKSFATFKLYSNQFKQGGKIKGLWKVDEETGEMRAMTPKEQAAEMTALKELGIL